MEEAKKRVYGRREVRMLLAYDGKLSKGQCLSVHQNARLVPLKGYHRTMLLGLY